MLAEGKPSQWPMVVFSAEHHKDRVRHIVFAPDESTFASISFDILCVCDSETGHCISGPFKLPYDGPVNNACFSPDGKHLLLELESYATVLDIMMGKEKFWIKGSDFVFICHNRRIASTHWIDEDGKVIRRTCWGDSEDEGGDQTGIVVKLWDASNGALICNKLFEVNDVAVTRFSPDGRFLAVERISEHAIELWNLEDNKDPRRFLYPLGNKIPSLRFSPTSDSLMAAFWGEAMYLWRLNTQEMASFSWNFGHVSHVIYSPLTNYVFIKQDVTVEIWDISTTGSKLIWETNPPTTSPICSTYPSHDGHRLLVGCEDGSVRMWDLDLENLAMNQANTMDTRDDADIPQFIGFSHSGKIVATQLKRSHTIEFLDTTTGEVEARMDIDDGIEIAFSFDEDQAVFWSRSLITVCDIKHPDNRVSFSPWPRKDVQIWQVAFRKTCNDLVICALYNDTALLQVWHRQDPAGFECTYSLTIKSEESLYPVLAPDGLTVVIVSLLPSTKCHSWNDTAQFCPVDFDDQKYIHWPKYSPDGKLFACWSCNDSHVRVWDTRTGQLVGKFQTSRVDAMAISPTLIQHSPSDRFIALWHRSGSTIHLFDIYTGHLCAQILGPAYHMAFIQDTTKLACYFPDFGLRIWDIADLTDKHWHSAHGYELMLQGMTDGWVMGRDDEPLFWVPVEHRDNLWVPPPKAVYGIAQASVDLSCSRLGRKWTECIDKEWLREVEQKGKEVGELLETKVRPVLS